MFLLGKKDKCIPTIEALNGGTAFKFNPFFIISMLIKLRVLIGIQAILYNVQSKRPLMYFNYSCY